MVSISEFLSRVWASVSSVSFDCLLIICLSAFGGVYLLTLFACLIFKRLRTADKRPFLHFLNAYTAITLAVLSLSFGAEKTITFTALFWLCGYLLYGFLCLVTKSRRPHPQESAATVSALPPAQIRREAFYASVPAAQSGVRLEHAISIAEKLLAKNLGKGDRQELERMKATLTVMRIKGTLTPQESDELNDVFNALLKLMAKYNL